QGDAGRVSRRTAVGRHDVVADGFLDVGRQEGVVVPAQVEVIHRIDRAGGVGAVRVDQIDVEEGRLTTVEGVFRDVLGFAVQVDVVGQLEGRADLIALGFRARNARAGREVSRVFAVAADVGREVDAGVAEALAEVNEASAAV